jgi:hypothetical protein
MITTIAMLRTVNLPECWIRILTHGQNVWLRTAA